MMTPRPPRAKKYGSTAWTPLIAPTKFASTSRAWASSGITSNGSHRLMPALLTQTSMPKVSAAVRARSRTAAGSVTSVGTVSAHPPNAEQSRATSSRSPCRRAASTTSAPRRAKARAAASPMPPDAPVTTVAPRRLVAVPLRPVDYRASRPPLVAGHHRTALLRPAAGAAAVRRTGPPRACSAHPGGRASASPRAARRRCSASCASRRPGFGHVLGRVDRRGGAGLVVAEVGRVPEERRVGDRGHHRADVDAGLVQHLHPQRLGEAAHGELAGRVGGRVRLGGAADDRAVLDQHAVALPAELAHRDLPGERRDKGSIAQCQSPTWQVRPHAPDFDLKSCDVHQASARLTSARNGSSLTVSAALGPGVPAGPTARGRLPARRPAVGRWWPA